MAFGIDIRTAPEYRGELGTPSGWSGTGTSAISVSGTYKGAKNKTYTLTAQDSGTIGTTAVIRVDWDDGEGSTGRLYIGTDASYTAGDEIILHEGVMISFAAGTTVATETATVEVESARRLPIDAQHIEADAAPLDIALSATRTAGRDDVSPTLLGDLFTTARTIARNPEVRLEWQDDSVRDAVEYVQHERHQLTVGEDYDESTVVLWRGCGESAMIGRRPDFARTGAATYVDKRSGLVRSVAASTPRYESGQAHVGMVICGGTTNLLTQSSAKSGATYWTASGTGAAVAYETSVLPPVDRADDGMDSDFKDGVLLFTLTSSATTASHAHSNDVSVASVTKHTGSVWLKGRGDVILRFRGGVGSPSTVRGSTNVTLTNAWTRYSITAASGLTDNTGDIALFAAATPEATVCHAWGWQLEATPTATDLVETDGGSAARNAETLNFYDPIPAREGTVSVWFYWAGGDDNSTYRIIEATGTAGSERFALWYNDATDAFNFFTNTTGGSSLTYSTALSVGWHHVAVTWEESGTAGSIDRALYLDDSQVATDTSANWEPTFGTGFQLGGTVSGSAALLAARFEELRIDNEAKDLTEMGDWYDRLTDDHWLHVHRDWAGRHYRVAALDDQWLAISEPAKMIGTLTLEQSTIHEDSAVIRR